MSSVFWCIRPSPQVPRFYSLKKKIHVFSQDLRKREGSFGNTQKSLSPLSREKFET